MKKLCLALALFSPGTKAALKKGRERKEVTRLFPLSSKVYPLGLIGG